MGSYELPDFDFGELSISPIGSTLSPTRMTFPKNNSPEKAAQGPDAGSDGRNEDRSDGTHDIAGLTVTQTTDRPLGTSQHDLFVARSHTKSVHVSGNPARLTVHGDEPSEEGLSNTPAEDWTDDEDKDMQRAIALSKKTAEEDEERRRARQGFTVRSGERQSQRDEGTQRVHTAPPSAISIAKPKLHTASLSDNTRDTLLPPASESSGPGLSHRTNPISRKPVPYAVSPLSSSSLNSYGSATNTDISESETMLSRNPSNTYRPPRTPVSQDSPWRDAAQLSPPTLLVPDALDIPDPGRERRPSQSSGKLSIRDASRSRSGSVAAVSSAGDSMEEISACEDCQQLGTGRSYCNVCHCMYCEKCWDKQAPHRKKRIVAGSVAHEKTDRKVAMKVHEVLEPQLDDNAREQLHVDDADTTWFGVAREDNQLPLFRDYGRYANLIAGTKELRLELTPTLSAVSESSETLYPSLISFVGQTGAGKSTLIKLLIDLKSEPEERFPTPVVGGIGKDVPTSEDVHLYLDPDSSMSVDSQAPLLFADCEGLDGGERDPVGAKLKKKMERQSRQSHASGLGQRRQKLKYTSERELTWADTPKRQGREFAVAHLYPRLLYTFSDVIVFVLKNPRVIESVLVRLVDWAQAALEKSSNQPVLPHAIIALNACENGTPEELWEVETATSALLENLSRTVFHNDTFKKRAQFWRERDRQIESVEQLILSYYSSIHVVRIPTVGRPNLIQQQVEKLSDRIRWASKAAREQKADLRMLLDADEFQPYLQVAFDHFAQDLTTPFDFVQASFTNSPIPNDFGGNILKLALQVMECWQDLARGETIFEELSYLVASCIMLDAARNKYRGKPDAIFPMYLEHIDNALENFCLHWPCEHVSKAGRCVNVRSGHGAKGHQLKSGKLLSAGDYESSFSFDSHRLSFQADTYHKLVALNAKVQARVQEGTIEEQAAADIHRDLVLPVFFKHASRGDPQAFVNHTVCFCCLFEPPEHALPCGHVLCTSCLKTYGTVRQGRDVEIPECPMEGWRFRTPWKVCLKPPTCGIRILTLDGGGVRGIVELEILKAVEKELGNGIAVQNLFDLIVGTSTGGIIALGLTARNWTLNECITHFESLCKKAFTERRGISVPGVGWFVENYHHSKYETQPLHEALIEAFGEDQYLFGGRRSDSGSMDIKVAVTATSEAGNPVVLANYNRLCLEKLQYHFQRPEKLIAELRVWEVARATSAAPRYFKPFRHEPSKQVYVDGGLYHNNPIHVADSERRLIWPGQQDNEPDIVVSVGTLFCDVPKEKRLKRRPYVPKGIIAHGMHSYKMGLDHIHAALDSESTWRGYMGVKGPGKEHKGRYIRINPEVQQPPPKLDEVDQMRLLQETTRFAISAHSIQVLAQRLVAVCFYLETDGEVREDPHVERFEVTGYIHCRLSDFEIAALAKFIQRNAIAGHDPHFIIKEKGNEIEQPQEVRLDKVVLTRMIQKKGFRMGRINIRSPTTFSHTEVSLCLTREISYPISGFPRQLHAGRPAIPANRHILTSTNSIRWAARTSSQQKLRSNWQPPVQARSVKEFDMIEHYSDTNHLLGNATSKDLMHLQSHMSSEQPSELDSTNTRASMADPIDDRELPTEETQADRYFVARGDFSSPHSTALNLKKGDLVKINKMSDDGWWLGQLPHDPKLGWMPSSWLEPAGPGAHTRFHRNEMDGSSIPVELAASHTWPSETSLASQEDQE